MFERIKQKLFPATVVVKNEAAMKRFNSSKELLRDREVWSVAVFEYDRMPVGSQFTGGKIPHWQEVAEERGIKYFVTKNFTRGGYLLLAVDKDYPVIADENQTYRTDGMTTIFEDKLAALVAAKQNCKHYGLFKEEN